MFGRSWLALVAAAALLACGSETNDSDGLGEASTGIELGLTTLGRNGTEFRLAPASFAVQRNGSTDPALLVDASADQSTVVVPVAAGNYTISLQPGWQLNRVPASGVLEPVPATLIGSTDVSVDVWQFETTPVNYPFQLGQSQLAIGVSVEEDLSSTSDGYILSAGNGLYEITFSSARGGAWRACCFASVAEARAAYPGLDLRE